MNCCGSIRTNELEQLMIVLWSFRRWFAYYFDQNFVKFSVLALSSTRSRIRGLRGQRTDPRTEDKAKDKAKESEARTRPHILSSRQSSSLEDEAVLKEHNTEQYAERTRLAHPSTTAPEKMSD